ncbi:MAG: helix-hairpin-helix domain-containing protein [Ignavibacteriaceae bacterium]|jgi:competence ComEA-like helix-hairpin-helix protein|nr:helix-hairpin-helix domain-containing protein [Ignavibacteriaceae bacterium]
MFERLSKRTGLTKTEIKILGFLISVFFIGIIYKTFFNNQESNPYLSYDYEEEDTKFYAFTSDSASLNSQKSGSTNIDYKQEVLDFNTQDFKNIKKKILPAEKSINLNTAAADELANLPGIGEKTAQKIIEYRLSIKRFKNVDQLLNVKNIGDKKLKQIRKYIYID